MFCHYGEALHNIFGGRVAESGAPICGIYKKVNILNDSGFH